MSEPNLITKLFPLFVAAFGWQVHGLLFAVGLAVAFVVVTIASNMQVMSAGTDDWSRVVQRRKWIIFSVFMVGIAISGAQMVGI